MWGLWRLTRSAVLHTGPMQSRVLSGRSCLRQLSSVMVSTSPLVLSLHHFSHAQLPLEGAASQSL